MQSHESTTALPVSACTIAIEWENPRDVEARWVSEAARALAKELASSPVAGGARHRVLYLYDESEVDPGEIRAILTRAAPELWELADVELVPTPGFTYYQLKSHAAHLADTELVLLLDSDVQAQPGWLRGLQRPFEDPDVKVASGVTSLAPADIWSRTMATIWIFDLPSEAEVSARRLMIHANNCAFRTAFLRENPFPESAAFKKQCGLWLEDVLARGHGFVRTAEARTLHAPHSGPAFIAWRGYRSGLDRDVKAAARGKTRAARVARALWMFAKRLVRVTERIVQNRHEVGLRPHAIPVALLIGWSYYGIVCAGQIVAALTRWTPVAGRPIGAGSGCRAAASDKGPD
jgi:hypothetical protein